jgi:hypothetical protein
MVSVEVQQTMRKWGDLQLALQLGFWVTMIICNSSSNQRSFTSISVIEEVAWIATNATHHMWNHIQM